MYPTPPPPMLPASERVRLAWMGRYETDYLFSFWSALGWTLLTFGVYGLYVIYQLVRRMRDHNRRRLELLDAAVTFGWEEATRRGVADELVPSFQRAAAHLDVMRRMSSDFREPIVWVALSLVARGVFDFVAFVLLDQDLVKHDNAEVGVEYELAVIYERLGQPLPWPDPTRVKHQDNYPGRIIASIASLGLYMFWWFHDQMAEPNRHFERNWPTEDALAAAVRALIGA